MADDVFKFQNPPFSAEGSGKFLYLDAPRRRILADLIAHICDGEGPILLVAEPGMGKTMLLDRLAEEAGAHNIRIVFSLGSAAPLASAAEAGSQPTAFILDNGNGLPLGVWHDLVSLPRSSSTPPGAVPGLTAPRLAPIVIALTPDLLDWLFAAQLVPRNAPLDRVFRLPPFAARDVGRFIALRLRVAGVNRPEVFTPESVDRIARVTDGVPARINRLCEASLAEAARRGRAEVGVDIVEAATAAVELETPRPIGPDPLPPAAPPPDLSPGFAAAPSAPGLRVQATPSIGIVGSGYGPSHRDTSMRKRRRQRRIPLWGGAVVATGVGALALLGYIAGPTPSPSVAPATTSSDATGTVLESRPELSQPPAAASSESTLLTPLRPADTDLRPADVPRQFPELRSPAAADGGRSVRSDEAPNPEAEGKPVRPAAAATAPAVPEPPVAPPPSRQNSADQPAAPAKAPRPTTDRAQPRNAPATHEPVQQPAEGEGVSPSNETADGAPLGRPRPAKELIEMGNEFRDAGDPEWARRLYRAAQEQGSAKAAVAEAETYDPQYTAASSQADPDEARRLYARAAKQGDREATKRLEALDQWLNEQAKP
ncbi:MAG: hypothetical protein U1E66_12505 [Rhodospirillales bacterium]